MPATFTEADFADTKTNPQPVTFSEADFEQPAKVPDETISEFKPTLYNRLERIAPSIFSTEIQPATGKPRGIVPNLGQGLSQSPLDKILPEAVVKPDDSKTVAVGKEAYNLLAGIPKFATSMAGIVTAPIAAAKPALTAAAFGADTLKNLGQQIIQTHKDWDNYSPAQKAAAVTDMVGTGALATLLGAGAAKGFAEKPSTIKEQNATSRITSAKGVSEPEVRPRMGQEAPLRQQGQAAGTQAGEQQAPQRPPSPQPETSGSDAGKVNPILDFEKNAKLNPVEFDAMLKANSSQPTLAGYELGKTIDSPEKRDRITELEQGVVAEQKSLRERMESAKTDEEKNSVVNDAMLLNSKKQYFNEALRLNDVVQDVRSGVPITEAMKGRGITPDSISHVQDALKVQAKEPTIEFVTPLDPQTGNPIEKGQAATAGVGAMRAGELGEPGSRDVTGLAARVRQQRELAGQTDPTSPGKGIAPEASVERGRQLLQAGANPEKIMQDFEQSNRASSDDFAVVRAHQERLARETNQAEEKYGTDSQEFRDAYNREAQWSDRTKAMQTEWAKAGHAQQGEVDIDTGTFSGLKRAYRDAHEGEELPVKDEKKAKQIAEGVRKVNQEQDELFKQIGDAIEKETKPKTPTAEKIPTVENTRSTLSDYKGGKMTTPQVRAMWNYAKKNYIDKGNANFSDIVQKVSTDLGLSFKQVADGLAQPKSVKKLTNELWRKQTDARRVSEDAKRWVRQTGQPILGQAVPRLARLLFGLKVAGHGGVAFGTHAPMVGFMPKYTKTYFSDFGKMYKMVFSPAEYEMNVQALRADPNFNIAARAGLVNDPYKVEDFNNPDMANIIGSSKSANAVRKSFDFVSGSGNRGYFALKILRQDMFNQGWDKLPDTMQTPEMAKAMADDINHITGVVKSSLGNKASIGLFAPRLLMSRAAFLVGDPYKAVEIATTAMSPKKWAALPPEQKFMVLNQVKQKATILAVAYGLLKANQALLSASGSKQQINTTDPTKSDFMKFKVAGMDFSYGNAMLNMARLPVRLWTIGKSNNGKLSKLIYPDESMYSAAGEFARSQASPIASLGLDLVFKGDYQNRPLPQIPGYGKPIPMPKRLAAQGIKPYTWPEFFAEQALPIPLEEAAREVWRTGFGFSPEQEKSLLKAAGTTIVMMGTGGRLTEDLQPKKPASPLAE